MDWKGLKATIVAVNPCPRRPEEQVVYIKWDNPPHNDYGYNGDRRDAFVEWLSPLVEALDLSKPICTRDGKPVKVSPTGDPGRPIRALVSVGDREVELTFQPNGYFYKEIEQDYDLVNSNV